MVYNFQTRNKIKLLTECESVTQKVPIEAVIQNAKKTSTCTRALKPLKNVQMVLNLPPNVLQYLWCNYFNHSNNSQLISLKEITGVL